MVTSSGLERALNCASSEVLPHVHISEPWTNEGIAAHDYLEVWRHLKDRDAALETVPEQFRDLCAVIDLGSLPPGEFSAEVAFAYDYEKGTARVLGHGIKRQYELGENETAGTADMVGIDDDYVYVDDYKNGWGDVTEAQHNPQIISLALYACLAYERNGARVSILRKNAAGEIYKQSRFEFDLFHLVGFAPKIRDTMRLIKRMKADPPTVPTVAEGKWCRYCPAKPHCPAKTALIRGALSGDIDFRQPLELRETVAKLWLQAKELEKLIGDFKKRALEIAAEEPIDLGNGKVLGEYYYSGKEKVSGDVAYTVLSEMHGEGIAQRAVSVYSTKARIREALREVEPDTPLAKKERAVIGEIRERGGITSIPSIKVGEHKKSEESSE